MNIYFSNIRLIDPVKAIDRITNIWIKDGIILKISDDEINIDGDTKTIKGDKLICSPGLFDMHVHFWDPGYEYKEDLISGSSSAANGGYTGVVCMPNTDPTIDNAIVVEYLKQKSKGLLTDIHFAAALTKGREGSQLSPMIELDEAGVVMFTDEDKSVSDSNVMRTLFDYAATRDLLLAQNCEDVNLTHEFSMNESDVSDKLGLKGYPYIAEEIIVARDVMMSEYCGRRRFHVQHISTNGSVRIIREARSRGLRVSSEVTPYHFTLIDKELVTYNTSFKMNPPLRRMRDRDAIIEGLVDGTIECIVSDHSPHALHEKDVEYEIAPFGVIGLETTLALTLTYLYHTKVLSMSQIIEKISTNPRRILKLDEIDLSEGKKANLTIFDPNEEWLVDKMGFMSKGQNTPFNGVKLKGKPKYTINNNQVHTVKL